MQRLRFKDGDMVPVSVAFEETELRELLKKNRARWEPQMKMCLLRTSRYAAPQSKTGLQQCSSKPEITYIVNHSGYLYE